MKNLKPHQTFECDHPAYNQQEAQRLGHISRRTTYLHERALFQGVHYNWGDGCGDKIQKIMFTFTSWGSYSREKNGKSHGVYIKMCTRTPGGTIYADVESSRTILN